MIEFHTSDKTMSDYEVFRFLNNVARSEWEEGRRAYNKAIRVTLISLGYDRFWVEGRFREMLDKFESEIIFDEAEEPKYLFDLTNPLYAEEIYDFCSDREFPDIFYEQKWSLAEYIDNDCREEFEQYLLDLGFTPDFLFDDEPTCQSGE